MMASEVPDALSWSCAHSISFEPSTVKKIIAMLPRQRLC